MNPKGPDHGTELATNHFGSGVPAFHEVGIEFVSLDQLPFNLFDLVLLAVCTLGILRGRKQGMSAELLLLLNWLAVVIGCGAAYEPVGRMIAEATVFSLLSSYLMAYVGIALLIFTALALLKRALGGKLLGSDIFGRSEYYLGMGAGLVRFVCMLIATLALLNARHFNPVEVRAMERYQNEEYGSTYFPTLYSLQAAVFEKSISGPWIRDNLSFLLIKQTEPESKQLHQKELTLP